MNKDKYTTQWLSFQNLANFIAEFTKDGQEKKGAWEFYHWLEDKSNN